MSATKLVAIGLTALVLAGVAVAWLALGRNDARVDASGTTPADACAAPASASPQSRPSSARETLAASPPVDDADRMVVQVVDTRGRPRTGIMVAYWLQLRPGSQRVPADVGRTREPDGTLELRGVKSRIETLRKEGGGLASYGLGVRTFGIDPDVIAFDADRLPAEVVRIVAPPCGGVVAKVVDSAGEAVRQQIRVTVSVQDAEAAYSNATEQSKRSSGTLRLSGIALGKSLRVGCSCDRFRLEERTVRGPVAEGEDVEVTWRLADTPILTGLVLAPDGTPLPRCAGRLWAPTRSSGPVQATLETDDNGRFRVVQLPELAGARSEPGWFEEGVAPQATGRRARLSSLELRAGEQDVGNLHLVALPFLVSVNVVEPDGKAVPGGPWWLTAQVRRAGRIFPLRSSARESAVTRETPPGHGEYFGEADDGELVLVGGGFNGYLDIEPIPFVRGTRDLRVELTKGGSLEARILADQDVHPSVLLRNEANGHLRTPESRTARFLGLRPGSYALEVRIPFEPRPVAMLEHLVVESGKQCSDPRLDPLDLRAALRKLRIRVTDAQGRPARDARVGQLDVPAGQPPVRVDAARDGVVTLTIARPSVSIAVGAHGCRPKTLRDVAADTTVALDAGVPVRARLAAMVLPDGVKTYCYMTAEPRELDLNTVSSVAHRPGEAVDVGHVNPGSWQLIFVLSSKDKAERLATRRIEVVDSADPQLFEVQCAPAELDDALRRLGRR